MQQPFEIRSKFEAEKEILFTNKEIMKDAFKFCINYSILVEEYIFKVLWEKK